jgi:hypothetical protein
MVYSEHGGDIKNLKIERNVKIKDKLGNTRQIDVYWEYCMLGQVYKTAVECKNHESLISIEVVESFVTKIRSLGISRGIIATKKDYQSGAISVAKDNNIALLTIREPMDNDWEGRIRKIILNMHIKMPSTIDINSIDMQLDRNWVDNNLKNFDGKISFNCLNNEIFITNFEYGKDVSFWDLENSILSRDISGDHIWEKKFDDSFLVTGGNRYKILSLKFKYHTPIKIKKESILDFSDHLFAIMEYIGDEKKIAILRDGKQEVLN